MGGRQNDGQNDCSFTKCINCEVVPIIIEERHFLSLKSTILFRYQEPSSYFYHQLVKLVFVAIKKLSSLLPLPPKKRNCDNEASPATMRPLIFDASVHTCDRTGS